MSTALDLAGQKFGKLIAIERVPNRNKSTYWLCQCDCGSSQKAIQTRNLTSGRTQSCGCLVSIKNKERVNQKKLEIKKICNDYTVDVNTNVIGIYKITNQINNKSYIGQSINIGRRWNNHKSNSVNSKVGIGAALNKYGFDNFLFEIIEECQLNQLNEKEVYWIEYYNTYYDGYNLTKGGNQYSHNVKISDEDLIEIINLLRDSDITQTEIARIFSIGEDTVSEINQGKTRIISDIEYPIRNNHTNICTICNKSICKNKNKLCLECYRKEQRKNRPEPLELAKMIIENGFESTGRIFNVSGNTIKKWCKTYNIPHLINDLKKWYIYQ